MQPAQMMPVAHMGWTSISASCRSMLESTRWTGKVSRQFLWLVGLHVTMLITVMAALFGLVAALLPR